MLYCLWCTANVYGQGILRKGTGNSAHPGIILYQWLQKRFIDISRTGGHVHRLVVAHWEGKGGLPMLMTVSQWVKVGHWCSGLGQSIIAHQAVANLWGARCSGQGQGTVATLTEANLWRRTWATGLQISRLLQSIQQWLVCAAWGRSSACVLDRDR